MFDVYFAALIQISFKTHQTVGPSEKIRCRSQILQV